MHAAAQHFAVIDFQRPVNLTDVFIPPCESLSSISLYAWKEQQTEKEAVHVITFNKISEKVLILTDIIPSIKCRYLKVISIFNNTCSIGLSRLEDYCNNNNRHRQSIMTMVYIIKFLK